ncbi:MAG: hypothetical protein ABJN75_05005 [Hoeflea sp.]|uniref:hypothetical protein n=1 Tax=Hoeflea sp. TaxID=1940281 RepID=UPI003296F65A
MMRKGKLVEDGFGPSIEGPAENIIIEAWEAGTPAQRVKLARKALSVDLNAIDAYNILGIHAPTLAEKIALFREATVIGEQLFAPLLDDEEMEWWGFIGTRPWMRAQHNLGLALLEAQDLDGAISVFKFLIALNQNDNQGIRYLLLRISAETGNYDDCRILFGIYPDDFSIEFPATKLLIEMSKAKPKKNLAALLTDIKESNAHLLACLKKAATSGKWPAPSKADYVQLGSKQHAHGYLAEFENAWTRKPRILENFLALPDIQTL